MCQLNVYCVPNSVEKEKVLALMREYMGFEVAECIDQENPVPSLKGYSFYISGGMRCNCDSLPCKFQSEDKSLTFSEHWQKITDEQRARLNALKDFMERKEYSKEKRAFDKLYKKYSKEMNAAYACAREYEMKRSREIMEDKNLSEQEKNRLMHEEVYPKVNELMQNINNDERVKRYYDFLEENRVMWNTYALTKKRAKKKTVEAAPIDGGETVEFSLPSFCIYDMIDELGKNTGESAGREEYAGIRKFVESVLELTDEMKLLCFWQDGADVSVEKQSKIKFGDLNIECLAHLEYSELLTIEK